MNNKNLQSMIWFILGFGIFAFTRMSKLVPTIPIAILIAPIFILRFNRTQPIGRGNLLTLLGFILSINLGLWGLFEIGSGSLIFNLVRSTLLAVLYFLPYLMDRRIYENLKKDHITSALANLTFPTITTAVFFLSSLEGPFDGAIQSSKFVFGPTLLKQQLSIVGIWSYIFLTSWFASLVNQLWETNFDWRTNKLRIITYVSIVAILIGFGAVNTSRPASPPDMVKVAAVIITPEAEDSLPLDQMWSNKQSHPFEERLSRIEKLTKTAASNQAKIVAFQEFAMLINENVEARLREEYQRIAQENNIYLSITYAYYAKSGKGENIHLFIDPSGKILLNYTKRYVSGLAELDLGEAGIYLKGPEVIQSIDTPYGRIAISICRDMEFTHYIRQAGIAGVDIMLSPAWEEPKGLVIHSSYLRTIENGFSLVRPTYNGISVAVDYHGNIISQMDSDQTTDGIMYADLPIKGVQTLYTNIGDLLGWICVIGLLGLIPLNIFLAKKYMNRSE